MNKGYSVIEFLIGILLSFLVLHLCIGVFKYVKIYYNDYPSQDLISSLQLHQILNIATEINVNDNEIYFKYFNEERTLYYVNKKIILKPGTIIYYLNVDSQLFYVENNKIYLQIERNNKTTLLLIGLL